MRKALTAIIVLAAVTTSGCAMLGGKRAAPNEFDVARNAPLIIPPDFTLVPPVAGTQGTAADAQQQAIDVLFGGPAPRPQSEISLLDQAGRANAPIGIRSTVADPDTRIVDKGPTTLQILQAPASNSNVASAQTGS
jgi:hypothetical protein